MLTVDIWLRCRCLRLAYYIAAMPLSRRCAIMLLSRHMLSMFVDIFIAPIYAAALRFFDYRICACYAYYSLSLPSLSTPRHAAARLMCACYC